MSSWTHAGRAATVLFLLVLSSAGAFAQEKPPVPKPFPKPPEPAQTKPAPPQQPGASIPAGSPNEVTLGLPIYPAAQFLASYDAGQGQRYYIFGVAASFADVVAYYKSVLKLKGELIFDEPPTQMFEVGRFKEDAMAFPPGVTVKDYTWGGLGGYPNPKRGVEPRRFSTIIQIVPIPPGGQD
jgi:hypothetical protein